MLLSFNFWEFGVGLPWVLLPCALFCNLIVGRFSLAQVHDRLFRVWMVLLMAASSAWNFPVDCWWIKGKILWCFLVSIIGNVPSYIA